MGFSTPFAQLEDIDQRCRRNAMGLPAGAKVEEDWVGIGFTLDGERLVANMRDVAEILTPPDTIRVPGVKNWVKGLANIRGTLIPILDMALFLGSAQRESSFDRRILVINKNNIVAGLLVGEVFGLRRFKPAAKSPDFESGSDVLHPSLEGAFAEGGATWNIFSIDRLISNESFLKVV